MTERSRVAVVGASGYAGAELVRLLRGHPSAELTMLCANRRAGQAVGSVIPSLMGAGLGDLEPTDPEVVATRADVAFLALPHGASAAVGAELLWRGLRVVDLSADFRLRELSTYQQWYGEHPAPDLIPEAVYGLVEMNREQLPNARLIAVPGCYPTASTLGLLPLFAEELIATSGIVIDAKSGVSGAGRDASAASHFPETSEGIRAYKVGGTHRHTPEIEQTLSIAAGQGIKVLFTPHLVPMTRGILATGYARATSKTTSVEQLTEVARAFYEGSAFVHIADPGTNPDTLWVRGSNRAIISYAMDLRTGTVVVQTVIDNLVKGAAGQAIQAWNVSEGWEETRGLSLSGIWP